VPEHEAQEQEVQERALFRLGELHATFAATKACSQEYLDECLARHASGDWGVAAPLFSEENEEGVHKGGRVWSAYAIDPDRACNGADGNSIWLITSADPDGSHRKTLFVLPSDYD
jgi:hypothetical protein